MFNRKIVRKALKQTWAMDRNSGGNPGKNADDQSIETSRLIFDIFGGEILKTFNKKNWHFYNRIDGERIDFSISGVDKSFRDIRFADLPSSPEETRTYLVQEDYLTFYMRFIKAFEETVGLKIYRHRASV